MSSRRSSRELRVLSASGALARPPGTTQAPQVLARIGRPAELERFPGGTAGKLGLLLAGNLAAIQAPDLLLGAQFPFLGKLLLAGTLGAAVPLMLLQGLPWLRRRRMQRVVAWDGQGNAPEGATVRLVGLIEPIGTPFSLPETVGSLVYALTRFHEPETVKLGGAPALEDIRGVPFQVRVSEQAAVRLQPDSLRLLDDPVELFGKGDEQHRALGIEWPGQRLGPVTRASLSPGEQVEVVGRLHRQVAPDGESAPARGIPFVLVVGPAWDGGVWIRTVRD